MLIRQLSRLFGKIGDRRIQVTGRSHLILFIKENTLQLGIKNKRLRTGWEEDYLLKLLLR